MQEIWKDVQGYEGMYQVSNFGRVKSLERVINRSINKKQTAPEVIMKPELLSTGYFRVCLWKCGIRNKKSIHRLVASHFIPNPDNKRTVNHIDGNKLNNHVSNLEWNTYRENNVHAFETGLINTPKKVLKVNKYTNEIVTEYKSIQEASRISGVSQSQISMCCNNKRKTAGGFIWKFKQ